MEDFMMKTETSEMEEEKNRRLGPEGVSQEWQLVERPQDVAGVAYMLHVARNYSHSRKYKATGWRCQAGVSQVREDQDHLGLCQGYSDLRQGLDLDRDNDMVKFFHLVMARRERQGRDG